MYRRKSENGFALIYAVFLIIIISFLGLILVTLVSTTSKVASENLLYEEALYCAESGKEIAIMKCLQGSCSNGTYTLNGNTISVVYLNATTLPDGRTLYTATSKCTTGVDDITRKIEFKFWK